MGGTCSTHVWNEVNNVCLLMMYGLLYSRCPFGSN